MNRIRLAVALATLGVIGGLTRLSAQDAGRLAAAKKSVELIRESDIRRDVDYLASDANMGRRTPSPGYASVGYDSAANYIARFLKEMGVKPMGDNGSYFVHYTVTRSTIDTTKVSGSIGKEPLKWGEDFYIRNFLVPGTRTGEVVYLGNAGLRRAKAGIDPYAGVELKGKWVLVNNLTLPPRFSRPGGPPAPGDTMGIVGIDYTTLSEEAVRRGALGVLLVPTPALINGWNRRASVGTDLNPSVGYAYSQNRIPSIVLSIAAVQRLVADTKVAAADILGADSTRRYPATTLLGKKVTIDFAATTVDAHPYNVVGLWEGSDSKLKDEWISLAAHLDGAVPIPASQSNNGLADQYNAADDNASGSAGNMAIVRALVAGPRPKRSILLIWDSGEEVGLWGTRFIAYGPWNKNLTLHVSNDMIGRSRPANTPQLPGQNTSAPDTIYVTGPKLLSSNTEANLQRAVKEFPFIALDRVYEDVRSEFYYPRTDAGPYLENGIPIMQFFNGTEPDYHRSSDEPQKLDIAKIMNVSKLSYGALWLAAEDPRKPTWDGIIPTTLWWVLPKNPK